MEILKSTEQYGEIKIIFEDNPRLTCTGSYYYRITSILINNIEVEKESDGRYFGAEFDYTLHNGNEYFGIYFHYETGKKVCKMLNIKKDSIFISLDNKTKEMFEQELKPKGEKMLKEQKDKEKNKMLEQDKKLKDDMKIKILEHSSYGFSIHCNDVGNSSILNNIKATLNINTKISSEIIGSKNFENEVDWGDYAIETSYFLTYKELKEIVPEIVKKAEQVEKEKKEKLEEKERIKKEKLDALLKKAIAENKKQEVCSWCEPCNDKYAECSLDVIHEYINPNGEFTIERHHTW